MSEPFYILEKQSGKICNCATRQEVVDYFKKINIHITTDTASSYTRTGSSIDGRYYITRDNSPYNIQRLLNKKVYNAPIYSEKDVEQEEISLFTQYKNPRQIIAPKNVNVSKYHYEMYLSGNPIKVK